MNTMIENFWLIAGLAAVICVILFLQFRRAQKPIYLVGMGVCLLAIVVLLVADQFVETPAEEVRKTLLALVDAAKVQDAQTIIDSISPTYNHDGVTHQNLTDLIRRRLSEYEVGSLQLNGLEITVDGKNAESRFVAVTSGSVGGYSVNRYVLRLAVYFEKEQDGWMIVRIDRFQPIGNTGEKLPLSHK